jgi:RND family efflux transporter MFP subunit
MLARTICRPVSQPATTSARDRYRLLPVIIFLLPWAICGPAQAQQQVASAPAALTVEVVTPQSRDWAQSIPASGWLTPWQEAVISAEASLKIIELKVEVGSIVKKGEILVQLEQKSVLADIRKQEAAVATAEANLAQARANADRARKVKGSGALSEQQATEYLITEKTAEASLQSERASLDGQQIKLEQTTIRAVDDGVISSNTATLGAVVSPGSELFRLIRQRKVEWQAEVAAQYSDRMRPGLKARIDVPDGSHVYGRVRRVAPTVNKDTGRVIVYVELPPDDRAKAGFNVSGAIELAATPALTVPESSLVFDDGMTYVFTTDDSSKVTRVKVAIGRRADGQVEILSGLAADARVVAAGGAFLSNGAAVDIVTAKEAAK